jgi:hypothetical protein
MSQTSDVEMLLLRDLECEVSRHSQSQPVHRKDTPPELKSVHAREDNIAAATPHRTQRSGSYDADVNRELTDVSAEKAALHCRPSLSDSRLTTDDGNSPCEAATPSGQQRPRTSSSSSATPSRAPSCSASQSFPVSAEAGRRSPLSPSMSLTSPFSSQRLPLSLGHPVVEFLTSVQLQGYVAHIIEDLGLRTMPALLSSVKSEADVACLLGPYASLQQQSDLWKGLRRWEKEEARRVKAEAEERRRQLLADTRHQRRKQRDVPKAQKKTSATQVRALRASSGEAKDTDAPHDSTGIQLPLTRFTQLMESHFFSLPNICERTPEEASVFPSSSPLPPCSLDSSLQLLRGTASEAIARGGDHNTLTSVSVPSLTTSATQFMRGLSYRCTHSRTARRCRCRCDDDRCGSGKGKQCGQVAELRVAATRAVPYDVDAEEDVDDGTRDEAPQDGEVYYAQPSSTGAEGAEERARKSEESSAPQSPSRQSSESHLSSLLCSLRELHDENKAKTMLGEGNEEEEEGKGHTRVAAGEEMTALEHEGEAACDCAAQAVTRHNGTASLNSLAGAAGTDYASFPNEIVASRHVSLSALSAHAELELVPPPLPPPFPQRVMKKRCRRQSASASSLPEATAEEDSSSPRCQLNRDEDGGEAGVAGSTYDAVAAPRGSLDGEGRLSCAVCSLNQLTEARVRLERSLCDALKAYNEAVAAAVHEQTECRKDGATPKITPLCAVLHPLRARPSLVAASGNDVKRTDELLRWAGDTDANTHSEAVMPKLVSPPLVNVHSNSTVLPPRTACENLSLSRMDALPLPLLPLPPPTDSAVEPPSHPPLPFSAPPCCTAFPLPPSGRLTTATEVVLSTISSAEVPSARTTARPTAVPTLTDDSHTGTDVHDNSISLVEAERLRVADAHLSMLQQQRYHDTDSASRAESVAKLTAGMQGACVRLTARCDGRTTRENRQDALPRCLRSSTDISSNASASLKRAEEVHAGGERCRSEESIWVEEGKGGDSEECVTAGGRSPPHARRARSFDAQQVDRRGEGCEGQREDSEDWWDSYGIDALDYTQNCIDGTFISTQDEVRGGAVNASQRGASPAAKAEASAERSWLPSPPPTEVVEVNSSDDDVEAVPGAASACSGPPAMVQTSSVLARTSPTEPSPVLAPLKLDGNANCDRLTTSNADGWDCRLQSSAWHNMTNDELRELCHEFGLEVRPLPPRVVAVSAARPPSSPSPYRVLNCSRSATPTRRSTPSPEWDSQFGLEGLAMTTTAVDAPARVSPRTCRELFQQGASRCEPPAQPVEEEITKDAPLKSTGAHNDEGCRCDRRASRMERETLLEALQLAATRLRFRCCVAPFFLHRVERFSGLPYKRVRAADLMDEGAVLTRDDLQQARQRSKAEEQAEVERCVLAALSAEAAEAVEHHAQHIICTTAAERSRDEDSGALHRGGATRLSNSLSSLPSSSATTTFASSCYEQLLLREPVNVEAVTATVQRSFPHIANTRVQQLLTLNEVIAEAVVAATVSPPLPSPTPLPASTTEWQSTTGDLAEAGVVSTPALSATVSSSPHDVPASQGVPRLPQEALRRANTRRYFAQRGYMTRRGAWGRGNRRGRGGRG